MVTVVYTILLPAPEQIVRTREHSKLRSNTTQRNGVSCDYATARTGCSNCGIGFEWNLYKIRRLDGLTVVDIGSNRKLLNERGNALKKAIFGGRFS
jgi:hypothetical protein